MQEFAANKVDKFLKFQKREKNKKREEMTNDLLIKPDGPERPIPVKIVDMRSYLYYLIILLSKIIYIVLYFINSIQF